MSIVATEIDIAGPEGGKRIVWFRCQDHLGVWHPYGPVLADPGYDPQTKVAMVEAKVLASLADAEFERGMEL